MSKKISTYLIFFVLILLAAATRWLPHPPNFSPIVAMALFSGAFFADRKWSMALPLVALFISDIFLGFHALMPVVYGSFALIVFGAKYVNHKRNGQLILSGVLASFFFFISTNFAVWFSTSLYPKTIDGLWASYVAAIPFYQNSLLSTFIFGAVFVTCYRTLVKYVPQHVPNEI